MVMFIDTLDLNSNTYLHINVKLVNLVGLNAAVYCSEILTIIKQTMMDTSKQILDDTGKPFIKLDRAYITKRTGLIPREQFESEDLLAYRGIVLRHPTINNAVLVDAERLVKILISGDAEKPFEGIAGLDTITDTKVKKQDTTKVKEAAIARTYKKSIDKIKDISPQLKVSLKTWVDAVVKTSHQALSKEELNLFVNSVKNFKNDDDNVILVILDTAIKYKFKVFEDALEKVLYNEGVKQEVSKLRLTKKDEVRRTETEADFATLEDVEGGDEF